MATCQICKYAGTPSYKSPCSECKGFSQYEYKKPMSNADRIRAMSDEELADVIMCPMEISCISDLCEKNLSYTCVECSLQWLREPAEEGAMMANG